jgi:DNA-binding beta-propeller fold protein YncE
MKKNFVVVALFALGTLVSAQKPAGRLLVLNKEDATMVVVDPESGSVLGKVGVGVQPHELVVSTDAKTAYASNYGTGPEPGHTISMIDVAAMKEIRRIDTAPLMRPHGLAFAGGKLYFTAEGSKKIARYDPKADKIDWEFETGQTTTHMVMVSKDLKTIFTSNIGSNSVSIIRQGAGGQWTQTTVAVGRGPEGIDIAPNGREVWSAHSQDGGVSVIDVASAKVSHMIDAGTKRSNRVKVTADGKFAVLSDLTAGDLVVVDVAQRAVVKRLPVGTQPEGVLIAPDGRIFVAVNGDNQIAVVDPKTWTVTKRISPGTGPDGMAWSQ